MNTGMITEEIRNWVRAERWDQVPVSISVIDRQFRIVEANRMFAQTYGNWQDRPCYSVYKERTEHCEQCAADMTFSDGQVRVREEKGVFRDGQQTYYVVQMVPLVRPDGEIPYIIEASTDITAPKKLEKEKLVAERLAAVGQTVAGLAHGIKNVLMGLEGGMYVVRSGMERGDGERIFQGWQMLEENMPRIPTVVKGYLEEGIPFALVDEEAVHTCLVNLVSNALDACEISDKGSHHVTLSTLEAEGSLFFEVADDGAGMDYEIKKKIFTTFFSTKGSGKGTGLGLLTTRKIVQEHAGEGSFWSGG